MSKAEEKALKKYPKMSRVSETHGIIPANNESHYLGDANEEKREGYIAGYHQAEKDLALTWKDVARLFVTATKFTVENTTPMSDEEFCQEVLKQYKSYGKKEI